MTEQTCLAQSQPLACQPTCLPPLGWRRWKAGSESLEPDGMVQVGRCPHTLSPGPGPQPQLAPSPEQAGALREVRGRVGISCDTLSPKPRKPRDRAGPAGMPAGSESCSLTPPGPGRLAEARGVQLGSTLCLQVSTQPSAGKMTSLPPPVGKVRPHTPSAHGIGQETGPLGGCSPGLPPALWQAPGPAPQPCGP